MWPVYLIFFSIGVWYNYRLPMFYSVFNEDIKASETAVDIIQSANGGEANVKSCRKSIC